MVYMENNQSVPQMDKKVSILNFIKSDRYANILRTVMTFAMLLVAYFLGMNATIWTNEQIELSYQKYCAPYNVNFTMLHDNNFLNISKIAGE